MKETILRLESHDLTITLAPRTYGDLLRYRAARRRWLGAVDPPAFAEFIKGGGSERDHDLLIGKANFLYVTSFATSIVRAGELRTLPITVADEQTFEKLFTDLYLDLPELFVERWIKVTQALERGDPPPVESAPPETLTEEERQNPNL